MPFTHIQDATPVDAGSKTTLNVVLGSPPTVGNVVCTGLITNVAISSVTCVDSAGKTYTVTPGSPANNGGSEVWLAYLLNAPTGATATITWTWTTLANPAAFASEFGVSGGYAFFDKEAEAATNASGTSIVLPSITPSSQYELLYSAVNPHNGISAPAAGGTLGGWTGSGQDGTTGSAAEYMLSASASPTAVAYTDAMSNDPYSCSAMAFKIATITMLGHT